VKSISFKSSYNLDVLSFLNVMTSDKYYVSKYQDEYNLFYPLLSEGIKASFKAFLDNAQRSNIAILFTAAVSLLENFNNRDLREVLTAQDEIEMNLIKSQFPPNLKEGIQYLPLFSGLIIQLIQELEDNGFKKFWQENRYPLICNRIKELRDLLGKNMLLFEHLERYKKLQSEEINVYICSYTYHHGTKIFRDSLIVDYTCSDKFMINVIAHELSHPLYVWENVTDSIELLKEKEFITKAYNRQDPQNPYTPIEMFIEENIVEALGTYIAYLVGFEDEPYKYFKVHV